MLERKDDFAGHLYRSPMGFLDLCDELAEQGRLGNDSAMKYTNKITLSAISFAGSEGRMPCFVFCCAVERQAAARPGIV